MPVGELETPALVLDLQAYRRNLRRMAEYIIRTHGLAWRPHMKAQKAPELACEAVAAGAAGVTCATLYEAEIMVDSGVENVLLANQVAGARKLARLARLARRGRVIAATDSLENAAQLNAAALVEGTVVPVLVEVDVGMNRCGVASGAPAAQLASCIHQMPGLRFLGVMGWEGHAVPLQGEQKQSAIAAAMERLDGFGGGVPRRRVDGGDCERQRKRHLPALRAQAGVDRGASRRRRVLRFELPALGAGP